MASARGLQQDLSRTLRVPAVPASVPEVRRALVEDLRSRGVAEQTVDESEIVVAELLTNAVRYARPLPDGTLRVHWKAQGPLMEVEVGDGGGETAPRPAPAAVWAFSGRGLRIVRSVAHEWGVSGDATGRTVWAALGGPSRRRGG